MLLHHIHTCCQHRFTIHVCITVGMQIFVGHILCECPQREDVDDYISAKPYSLPAYFANGLVLYGMQCHVTWRPRHGWNAFPSIGRLEGYCCG